MTIFHGDNQDKSRLAFLAAIKSEQQAGQEVIRLEGNSINLSDVEYALGASHLFSQPVVAIENVFSLPAAKKRTAIIELLKNNQQLAIFIWEKKAVGNSLRSFKQAKIEQFSISKVMFTWLDSLQPGKSNLSHRAGLLAQVLEQENEFLCLTMLCRQVRLLIQVVEGDTADLAPFIAKKMSNQAKKFSLQQLLDWHSKIVHIDLGVKTGSTNLEVGQALALLTLSG